MARIIRCQHIGVGADPRLLRISLRFSVVDWTVLTLPAPQVDASFTADIFFSDGLQISEYTNVDDVGVLGNTVKWDDPVISQETWTIDGSSIGGRQYRFTGSGTAVRQSFSNPLAAGDRLRWNSQDFLIRGSGIRAFQFDINMGTVTFPGGTARGRFATSHTFYEAPTPTGPADFPFNPGFDVLTEDADQNSGTSDILSYDLP